MAEGPVYDPGADWELPGPHGVPRAGSYGGGDGGGSAGFEYDEQTLHELVREWRELADEFRADFAQAEALKRANGPGLEYASGNNAELIRASGSSLSEALQQRARYCDAMAAKYVTALGKYATAEEAHAIEIGETTKGIL
ncbi:MULTISPECIES: hypothetical protein [Amycolatopsis]|uniref:PE domain-containing protein n=1 Tax=Amycolatopsis bullii TaxID=941987 RepID=A0ABQ3KD66_9PSEU|nr:hypothetical protein [Amycolatopsis bullii]GHG15254.1 hypothetical protein GCM10017567_36570 [Amycolatopsis bullii]